jgi:hypothetical protein
MAARAGKAEPYRFVCIATALVTCVRCGEAKARGGAGA